MHPEPEYLQTKENEHGIMMYMSAQLSGGCCRSLSQVRPCFALTTQTRIERVQIVPGAPKEGKHLARRMGGCEVAEPQHFRREMTG